MTKHLRLLMLALMVALTSTIFANNEKITFSEKGLTNGTQYKKIVGTDITCYFGDGSNDGKYYKTGSGIRVYGNGYMKVSTSQGTISKIVITYSGKYAPNGTADYKVDGGSYNYSTKTWTGEATSVKLTNTGSDHWRIQAVDVTYNVSTGLPTTTSFGADYDNQTFSFVDGASAGFTPPHCQMYHKGCNRNCRI